MVNALNINNIDIPTQVKSGDIFDIRLNLDNNEDDTIRNINIDLNLHDIPLKIISQDGINKINKNDEEIISQTLQVLPGSMSKIYSIPATITYENDANPGIILKKETVLTLVINEKPELDITSKTDSLIKGQKSKITVKVINKGLGDVKFLNVMINPAGFTLLSENQQYIGQLQSNDFDSVDFDVVVNQNSQNRISPSVTVNYEDIAGNKYAETKLLDLRVYDTNEAISLGLIKRNNTPYIILVLILLIILFFIYRRIRKRKK